MALCAATVEIEYTRGLLHELNMDHLVSTATPIGADNEGCRYDAQNKTGKRTRHINMRFHRVREAVNNASIHVHKVIGGNDPATSQMVADILTKATPGPLFNVLSRRAMRSGAAGARVEPAASAEHTQARVHGARTKSSQAGV